MKSNNKRVAGLILCLLCLAALLSGCDPAAGKRPVDYPNSRWVCQDPHIEIVVDEKGRYTSTLIGDDGEEKRFFLGFRSGYGADAYVNSKEVLSSENCLFRGECKFSKEKCTIILCEGRLWDDGYARLVFKRVE